MSRPMPKTKRGYEPFEVVSALQKAVRRSDPDAALYWSAELFKSGYAAWAWKRLKVIMTEDVGPAMDPGTVADIWALKMFAEESTRKEKNKDTSGEFLPVRPRGGPALPVVKDADRRQRVHGAPERPRGEA